MNFGCRNLSENVSVTKDGTEAVTAVTIAKQIALDLYLANSGTIQGSDPTVSGKTESQNKVKSTIEVTIEDQNDEGESWTIKMWVDVAKESLKVQEIRHQKNDIQSVNLPADQTDWKSLAKETALNLYTANTAGIQGSDPTVGTPKLIRTNKKTSTFLVVIDDSNDESESWQVKYLVEMANSKAFVLKLTEMDLDDSGSNGL